MAQDRQTYARATTAASVGFFVQLFLGLLLALVGLYAGSPAVNAAAWQVFGGLLIWAILWMLYFQHQLERREALETQELADADQTAAAIFEEAGESLALARKRLSGIYRIGIPIVSVSMAVYLLAAGLALLFAGLRNLEEAGSLSSMTAIGPGVEFGLLIVIFFITAFTAFLTARYVAGMTHLAEWQALRGGASYLMGSFVVGSFLTAAAIFGFFGNQILFAIGAVAVPGLMVLLGLEIALGLVFAIYRPRKPGEFVRPSFDSRILGALTRPESIGKIVSETINYQFGFEISRSWFYRLLSRALLPLTLLAVATLVAMTGVVVVEPHQKAVVTTWGANPRAIDAGLHLKWPWPMGRVSRFDFYRIHELRLGSRADHDITEGALLWTNQHVEAGQTENYMVTAPTPTARETGTTQIVAGEFAGADVMVKFRVSDVITYSLSATRPEALLEAIAAREVNRYFASRDVDTLLTRARLHAGDELHQRINEALTSAGPEGGGIGLEVVFVSVSGVHPPQDVADAFLEQIDALQEKQSRIEEARKEAIALLAQVAGSRDRALEISEAIEELANLRVRRAHQREGGTGGGSGGEAVSDRALAEKANQIERLLDEAGGSAAQALLDAKAYRWSHAINELARSERFRSELYAYRQAPDYYRQRLYLDTLAEALADRRKIIVDSPVRARGVEPADPVVRLDLKEVDTSLDSLIGE